MLAWFQSTPSGGKATLRLYNKSAESGVSIHAFRGEGDDTPGYARGEMVVSIHAFRGEGDSSGRPMVRLYVDVSIHAFRGEGDIT